MPAATPDMGCRRSHAGCGNPKGREQLVRSLPACLAWLWGFKQVVCRHMVSHFPNAELAALA